MKLPAIQSELVKLTFQALELLMNPTQEQYKWQLYILRPRQWVLSINIMPNQPVRGQWYYQSKNGTTFLDQTWPIKRNGSLILSRVFYISVIYWREVGQWTSLSWKGNCFRSGRSERSKWTPGRKVPKRSFHLTFDRNWRNFWQDGKHPMWTLHCPQSSRKTM